MLLHIKSFRLAGFASMIAVLLMPLLLTGCLSHWFLESSSRLQVENATKECTIMGVDVLSSDGSAKAWLDEMVLSGERSHVVEQDFVGDFVLRFRYTKSLDGTGKVLFEERPFDLDGGSLYLSIGFEGDSLTYRFR